MYFATGSATKANRTVVFLRTEPILKIEFHTLLTVTLWSVDVHVLTAVNVSYSVNIVIIIIIIYNLIQLNIQL